ncbi:c-type cytochrome [Anditalea andensis]|uniref:Cytochrome C n=1 Tax=Anditalea andensis TaxID=1048983 RepID=A0A074L0Q5_9BACT|nr:c-type cytochrome [Anditalea andensis]KEO75816.1 cytochrome C [Anditalea andensis]
MNTIRSSAMLIALLFLISCGGGDTGTITSTTTQSSGGDDEPQSIREGKGIGEITHVELTADIDENMVEVGKSIYDMKCSSCHKLNDQRVVGPGFENITNRRKPEWIMNMITNVDVMLDKDPEAQAMLEECLMRMPNQNVSVGDARQLLEFMRKNDKERTGQMDAAVN